jgi:hypothetical protein
LAGSVATGSTKKGRLTNLTQLTVDTSYWGLFRSDNRNPDQGDKKLDQAVPSLGLGRHKEIPKTNANSANLDLITAIAYTAGFHFGLRSAIPFFTNI